jgi:hypothetical protein
MRKKLLSLLALALCTASNMWALNQVGDVYQIGTAQDLADFATLVNGGTFTADAVLTADIDMSSITNWTAIGDWGGVSGTSSACYKGHFDGQGHKITGFNGTARHNYYGIFGVISSCLIENFSVYGTISTSVATMGGVAGYARDATPTIRNVHSYVDINNTANGKRVGGILGTSHNGTVVVDRCTYSGTLDGKDSAGNGNYGGIVGYVNNNASAKLQVTNCLFDGELKNTASTPGSCTLGGIIGYVGANITDMAIKNCLSIGTVTSTVTGQFYGAVKSSKATIVNSYYQGDNVNGSASTVTLTATKLDGDDARLTSGELCYLLNESVSGGTNWYQILGTDDYPLPYGTDKVYVNGSYNCDMTPKEGTTVTYSNTEGAIVDPHSYSDGICSACGSVDATYMTVNSDGYYEIDTPEKLIWFAALVNQGGDNMSVNAKLTDDIPLTYWPAPIGNWKNNIAYKGHFDGQGYTIGDTNFSYTTAMDYHGIFGVISENATVENFSVYGTVTNTAKNTIGVVGFARDNNVTIQDIQSYLNINSASGKRLGGILGTAYNGTVNLDRCSYFGTIEITDGTNGGNIGGIVGYVQNSSSAITNICNCLFDGTINYPGTSAQCGGIVGYIGASPVTTIKNCLSLGSITATELGMIGGRVTGTSVTYTNNYYKEGSVDANGDQSRPDLTATAVTSTQLSSGEVCYLLNGDQTAIAWYQTIGTNDEPTLDATNARVYVNGTVCPDTGAPQGTVSYSNAEGTTIGSHVPVDGFCTYCGTLDATYMIPVDGYYEIGNEKQLKWFAAYANDNHLNSNAKLTADIDLDGVTCTPIGIGSGNASPGATAFIGIFDGQGHSITNFNAEDIGHLGLFGDASGATIKNFSISGTLTVTGGYFGGTIACPANSTIENVHSALIINVPNSGTHHVAGVVGSARGGNTINKCSFSGSMTVGTGSTDNFAGVVAYLTSNDKVENCANYGSVTFADTGCGAGGVVGYLNDGTVSIKNCLNTGTIICSGGSPKYGGAIVGRLRNHTASNLTNNYWLESSAEGAGKDNDGNVNLTTAVEVDATQLASGYVTAKLGYAFHQNLGSDATPTLDKTKGYVTQIGAAGYSTQYITDSDVTIPSDMEVFAGVVNESSITLNPISGAIAAGEPVVLRGAAGFYNFMPTTGATPAASNDLQGSDGTKKGGDGIYALAKKDDVVGFYPVANNVTIPAGRAYLDTAAGGVKAFYGFEDNATGIEDLNLDVNLNGAIYNIAGQRLIKMQKGINIVNGKKVAIK